MPYQADLQAALDGLREQEFNAGRYNPVMAFIKFPITPSSPAPGAEHDSIEDAQEDADADGTRSILDIEAIADEPDFSVAAPFTDEELQDFFGTTQPSRAMVEGNFDLFEELERGQARYVILYADGQPSEIFFAGYSYD